MTQWTSINWFVTLLVRVKCVDGSNWPWLNQRKFASKAWDRFIEHEIDNWYNALVNIAQEHFICSVIGQIIQTSRMLNAYPDIEMKRQTLMQSIEVIGDRRKTSVLHTIKKGWEKKRKKNVATHKSWNAFDAYTTN